LIAEEVAKVNPNLVVRDENGEIYTVRYEAVNAMLLNEFLKEHRQVEEQKAGLAEMKSVISKQEELIAINRSRSRLLPLPCRKWTINCPQQTRTTVSRQPLMPRSNNAPSARLSRTSVEPVSGTRVNGVVP
jgi:hypothetical protein